MSEEATVGVRCRRGGCSVYDTEEPTFQKCGRCRLAKYCSKECQVEDWPLHKLMCHTDRHTYAEDGSVIPVGSSAVAAADRAPSSSEKKPAVPTADYISESEMDDKALFSFVMDKLQLQTNPFALLQHGKLNGTPGFIFVQTMSPLADYRNVPSARRDGSKLDRSLHVMYMTWEEFTTELAPEHPNPGLKKQHFQNLLRTQISKHNPKEELVSVAVFGCGYVACQTSPMAPYQTLVDLIESQPDMFQGQDEVQIFLDRD